MRAARARLSHPAALRLFDGIASEYSHWTAAELELLYQAARMAARVEDARARVETDGIVIEGARGGLVRHPALAVERASLDALQRLLKALRLEEAVLA